MKFVSSSIVLLSLLSSLSVNAQIKALGVKSGINYGSAIIRETFTDNGVDYNYATEEADVGLMFGIFTRVKFGSFFFQPELLGGNHQTRMKLSSITVDSILNFKQTRVDIPLLFGYSRRDRIRAYLGPVYTRLTENPVFSEDFFRDEFGSIFNGGTWALQMGFGFDMGRLVVDARFETNLGKISDQVNIIGTNFNFDHRMNTLQVSLGWDLIK